jgi:hypothetical protein
LLINVPVRSNRGGRSRATGIELARAIAAAVVMVAVPALSAPGCFTLSRPDGYDGGGADTGRDQDATSPGGTGGARPGTGGDRGAGGTTGGTGGIAAGTGGSAGTGGGAPGSGGAPVVLCPATVVPAGGDITDFSNWSASAGRWGTAGGLRGAIFSYADRAMGSTAGVSVGGTNPSLRLTGQLAGGRFAGGGLAFETCANGSQYNALEFTIGGSTGGCLMELQVATYSDKAVPEGACESGCVSARKQNLQTSVGPNAARVTVPFDELMDAAPRAFDPTEIVGVLWQVLQVPNMQLDCLFDLTIDDIKLSTVPPGR